MPHATANVSVRTNSPAATASAASYVCCVLSLLNTHALRLDERLRPEDRHDLRDHRVARGEPRFLVAPERILDDVHQALVAVGARLRRAGPVPLRNICTRSLLAMSGRAMLTASQSPRSIAAAMTDAVWNPPVQITGIVDRRLIARASGRFSPSMFSSARGRVVPLAARAILRQACRNSR